MFKTAEEKQTEIEKRVNQAVKADFDKVAHERNQFKTWYDAAGKDANGNPNLDAAGVTEFNTRNADLAEKQKTADGLRAQVTARVTNDIELAEHQERQRLPFGDEPDKGVGGGTPSPEYHAARETQSRVVALDNALRQVANAPEFRNRQPNQAANVTQEGVSLRALFTGGAGGIVPNNLTSTLILSAQRAPMVADLIPQTETLNSLIRYVQESVYTNNAATVAEGLVKPEAALATVEVDSPVRKIAVTLPVTEEQLADVPQLETYLRSRLLLMVMQVEENQLLSGNGTTPNLQGFLTTTGVQAFTQGSTGFTGENIMDAIFRANIGVMYTAFAHTSGTVINPLDWQAVKLTKTTYGEYLFGNPADAGPQTIWGNPLVVTPAIAAKTVLTGDFALFSHISRRLGLDFAIGYVNDQFLKNQVTLRVEERISLEIYRPAAFAKIALT